MTMIWLLSSTEY